MIEIYGIGGLRGTNMEHVRALKIAQLILHKLGCVKQWRMWYGERKVLTHRVDAVLEVKTCDERLEVIGIEVVSRNEDIEKNENKLKILKDMGEFSKAYVIKLTINEIEYDLALEQDRIIEVR